MLKKALKYAGIGFLIGIVVGNVIAMLTGTAQDGVLIPVSDPLMKLVSGSYTAAIVLQCLFSGLYGAICFGAVVFYDIERWPLALATAAHCAAIVLTYIPFGFFLGWLNSVVEMLIVAGIQIVVFFLIWLIMWSIYKKQVKELNKLQEKLKDKNREG